jgi:hypothetical protein
VKIDETMMLPATVREFVDKDHLTRFVLNLVVEEIDLEEVKRVYHVDREQPPFDDDDGAFALRLWGPLVAADRQGFVGNASTS